MNNFKANAESQNPAQNRGEGSAYNPHVVADEPQALTHHSRKFDRPQLDRLYQALPQSYRKQTTQKVLQLIFRRREITDYQMQVISRGKAHLLVMGKYLILDKIGKGASGTVFRAVHLNMNREVALKVLSSRHTKKSKAAQRFFREIQTAGRLQHPNIVAAFDSGKAHSHWYLVSEYVNGPNLYDYVRKEGPVSVNFALDTIFQAAQGLMFAHQASVIHRDIKPSNLIRTEHGEVKILDLGLVRWKEDKNQLKLTRSGLITGTPSFMAPEQANDAHSVDARSDIYSLGCTLFYLLTGRFIYDDKSVVVTLMAHQQAPVPVLSEQRADIEANLEAVFEKMVAKKPQDRYQSMAELCADLQALQNHSPPWNIDGDEREISEDCLVDFLLEMQDEPQSMSPDDSNEYFLDDSGSGISTESMLAEVLSTSTSHHSLKDHPSASTSWVGRIRELGTFKLTLTSVCLVFIALLLWWGMPLSSF